MSIGYLYIPFQFGECVCWSLTLTGTGTSGCVHVHLVNSEIHIALHTKAHGRQRGCHGAFKAPCKPRNRYSNGHQGCFFFLLLFPIYFFRGRFLQNIMKIKFKLCNILVQQVPIHTFWPVKKKSLACGFFSPTWIWTLWIHFIVNPVDWGGKSLINHEL